MKLSSYDALWVLNSLDSLRSTETGMQMWISLPASFACISFYTFQVLLIQLIISLLEYRACLQGNNCYTFICLTAIKNTAHDLAFSYINYLAIEGQIQLPVHIHPHYPYIFINCKISQSRIWLSQRYVFGR